MRVFFPLAVSRTPLCSGARPLTATGGRQPAARRISSCLSPTHVLCRPMEAGERRRRKESFRCAQDCAAPSLSRCWWVPWPHAPCPPTPSPLPWGPRARRRHTPAPSRISCRSCGIGSVASGRSPAARRTAADIRCVRAAPCRRMRSAASIRMAVSSARAAPFSRPRRLARAAIGQQRSAALIRTVGNSVRAAQFNRGTDRLGADAAPSAGVRPHGPVPGQGSRSSQGGAPAPGVQSLRRAERSNIARSFCACSRVATFCLAA